MTTGIIKRGASNANLPATPFSSLMDQFFQNNLSRFFEDDFWGFNGLRQSGHIPVNLQETDKNYEMQVIAPGLKKEDFKIQLEGDLLTVAFERKEENNQGDNNQKWLKKEYKMESFSRSFTLDDNLDAEKIAATYRDGVLYVTLPKKEGAQRISRKIEIR